MARMSMAANGAHYANEAQKKQLAMWMKRDGCHTCGSKAGRRRLTP
jgi:hypothetical protein